MKRVFLFIAIACSTILANAAEEKYPSYIEVNGYAETEVTPDRFHLTITLSEADSKGKRTLEKQRKEMTDALKSLGINTDKQLTLSNTWSNFYKKKTSFATATYDLQLNKAIDIQRVTDTLTDIGISSVTLNRAECSTIKAVREETRKEAIRNARQRAESLAEAIGQSVGDCFYISDYSNDSTNGVIMPRMYMSKAVAMDAAVEEVAEDESIEFRSQKVTHSVSAKFILLPRNK